jgi:hypothetical protein
MKVACEFPEKPQLPVAMRNKAAKGWRTHMVLMVVSTDHSRGGGRGGAGLGLLNICSGHGKRKCEIEN